MADAPTPIPMTNADRDRAALAADAAAGNAEYARMVQEFNDAPAQKIARYQAEWDGLQSNPDHLDKMAAGSEAALARETAARGNLAVAQAEAEAAHGPNRVAHALKTDRTDDPLFDGTIGTGGELSMHDMRSQIEEFRKLGLDDTTIEAAFNGTPQSPRDIGDAKWLYEQLMEDETWVGKLMAGNKVASQQLWLLNVIRNAAPIQGK